MAGMIDALVEDPEIDALLSRDAEIADILRFEAALAEAESATDLIAPEAAKAIGTAMAAFTPDHDALTAGLAQDGVVVPALLRQLRAAIGEPHAGALHFGATSQDAVDTGLILRLGRIVAILLDRLDALQKTFASLAGRQGDVRIMAHTRMQAALPFAARDKIATWTEPLARHQFNLAEMRRRLLVVQLGGPVGNRSSFEGKGDEIARRLAALLDLGVALPWHSQRDPIVEFGSLLALISGSLGKFGLDVTLMAQTEVREVTLKGGGGSSSMPHKSNPVTAELLVTLGRYNAALTGALQQAMLHENERSGAAWTLEWLVLPQMLTTTGRSLLLAQALAGAIDFTIQNSPQ